MGLTLTKGFMATQVTGRGQNLAKAIGKLIQTQRFIGGGKSPVSEGAPSEAAQSQTVSLGKIKPEGESIRDARASILTKVDLPLLELAPEAEDRARILAEYGQMAESGDWTSLLRALARADRQHLPGPCGTRLAALISAAVRQPIAMALAQGNLDEARRQLDLLQDRLELAEVDAAAAVILADAHLDLAEAYAAKPAGRGAYRDLVLRAEDVIAPFDPFEENLPQLAATRYRLLGGLDEAESLFADWYEDWSDLDPKALTPHILYARHLLPQHFGDLQGFERAARAAAKRTADYTGGAAYALMHLAAAHAARGRLPGVNEALFLSGLRDLARHSGGQAERNQWAAWLADLAMNEAAQREDDPNAPDLMLRGLSQHLRFGYLHELHLHAFQGGEAGVISALNLVFQAELAEGARLAAGPKGIEARVPLTL